MKGPDIVAIIQVAGPLLIELVELLLKFWGSRAHDDEIVSIALDTLRLSRTRIVDEHGTSFSYSTDAEPIAEAFIRGIIASRRALAPLPTHTPTNR